jgi:DNA-binding NtrC family response regulator
MRGKFMALKFKFDVVPLSEVAKEDADRDISTTEDQPIVMVVDDEKIIADTLSIILSRSGFSTVTANDGRSALEIAARVKPQLLISDVVMPGMTGVELAIELTQIVPRCKILLFSGQAATVDLLENARKAGFDFTTLTKPVHPTDMLRHVSEILTAGKTFSNESSSADAHLYQ